MLSFDHSINFLLFKYFYIKMILILFVQAQLSELDKTDIQCSSEVGHEFTFLKMIKKKSFIGKNKNSASS